MSETYSNNNPQPGDSERQLLVKILNVLNGSAASVGIQAKASNYSGTPDWTPTSGNIGLAIDTSNNNRIYWYVGGAWN